LAVSVGPDHVAAGGIVELTESAPMLVHVRSERAPKVWLAEEPLPVVEVAAAQWRVDVQRHGDEAVQHFVGDCPLVIEADGSVFEATIRRVPSRVTLDEYEFLLADVQRRAGIENVRDPLGRHRIWAQLAPRIPTTRQEYALVLFSLFERAAPALRHIGSAPLPELDRTEEWMSVNRLATARGRVDPRRFRGWDPPFPPTRPTTGSVLVSSALPRYDTPENRFVAGIVRRLAAAFAELARTEDDSETRITASRNVTELASWFDGAEWTGVLPALRPLHSFVLRDNPSYRAVDALATQLGDLRGLASRFPPGELEALLPINPYSLNVLYERWIQLLVRDWLETQLGALGSPAAFSGHWVWRQPGITLIMRLDEAYPRQSEFGVFVPVGKNRPDVAVECWLESGHVEVLTLDATYSQNPLIINEKFQYARNPRAAGRVNNLTGDPPLVTRWAAVATPTHPSSVLELRAGLGEARMSLPPSARSVSLLYDFLRATIGTHLAAA
jgi:hypothetical protein